MPRLKQPGRTAPRRLPAEQDTSEVAQLETAEIPAMPNPEGTIPPPITRTKPTTAFSLLVLGAFGGALLVLLVLYALGIFPTR